MSPDAHRCSLRYPATNWEGGGQTSDCAGPGTAPLYLMEVWSFITDVAQMDLRRVEKNKLLGLAQWQSKLIV